jgi:hypothetical protein
LRKDPYLYERLENIWNKYFSDVPRENMVLIGFGRKAKKRLGSIGSKACPLGCKDHTHILINGRLKDPFVPDFVIDATIAHELCHYTHGFCSPRPRHHLHPHRDGVVDAEMERRGLKELSKREWNWLQENWVKYLKTSS